MKMLRADDAMRLLALHSRIRMLKRAGVNFHTQHIEALNRVVAILLADKRAADRKLNQHPPPGFGKL